jgi:hypothetical protein
VTWLRFEPPQILNFYFDAYLGPDPADYFDADLDPAFHSDADLVRTRIRLLKMVRIHPDGSATLLVLYIVFFRVCVHF